MIKQPIIIIFSLIMISSCFTSCEEEYIIETDDFESKLVVNALFNHDTPWSVHVSNTSNILDYSTSIEDIENAKVEIFDQNGEFLYELLHQDSGIYVREDYAPSPKRGYSIKVSATGYHAVTAYSFVPEKSTLLINNFSITPHEKYDDVEVDFEIEDRSKLESYYIWEIVNIDVENGGEESGNNNQLSQTWINDLTNNPNDLVKGSREILENNSFGDGKYQGTYSSLNGRRAINIINVNNVNDIKEDLDDFNEFQAVVKLDPKLNYVNELIDTGSTGDGEGEEEDKIEYKYELRVMSISKELFDYYSSVEEYLTNANNNHSNQVPLYIYSNLDYGYGVFAGFSESVIRF